MMRLLIPALVVIGLSVNVQADEPASALTGQVAQAIVQRTNDFRQENELESVTVNPELEAAASEFAQYMAQTGKYGHRVDGRSPAQRAKAAGYEYCIVRENIAYRLNTGQVTQGSLTEVFVQGWIESPPHRENMLAEYVTQTGVGVATADQETYYAVQLFGRPKSAAIRVHVRNETEDTKTLVAEANDSVAEFELPARSTLTMTRCFPTTLRLEMSETELAITESSRLVIDPQGIRRVSE